MNAMLGFDQIVPAPIGWSAVYRHMDGRVTYAPVLYFGHTIHAETDAHLWRPLVSSALAPGELSDATDWPAFAGLVGPEEARTSWVPEVLRGVEAR